MVSVLAFLAGCASQEAPPVQTGYVVPKEMEKPGPDRVLEVAVPVAVPVEHPVEKSGRRVDEITATSRIQRTRIMVDPKHAIGGTYTPVWMDGFPIPVYAAMNISTDIEFPPGVELNYFGGSDMEDSAMTTETGQGDVAGWHVKTSYAGRGDMVQHKAHILPRYAKLNTQFTANLTMPDDSPRTIIFHAKSYERTRMSAVRPIMEDMEQQRSNNRLTERAASREDARSSANSGNPSICGVGSDTRYNVVVEETGLEWTQIARGKVYNDGKFTCIEFPPEGVRQDLPSVNIVMGKGQEYTADCTLMGGRHYVCTGVTTRLRLRGTTNGSGGVILLERTSK